MDEIKKKVIEIIQNVTGYYCKSEYYNEKLTGSVIRFSGLQLTYILLEIGDFYNIEFVPSDVENGGFNSVNSIIDCVKSKI
jgi:acyl carrier protein